MNTEVHAGGESRRLAWHQFRSDLRCTCKLAGFWLGALALGLASSLGWLGEPVWDETYHQLTNGGLWSSMAWGVQGAFFAMLTTQLVAMNSPSRTDGFLATRPMPKGSLVAGQALYLALVVLLPLLLQETIHLALRGFPARWILLALAERGLVVLPALIFLAAFAALWRDQRQFSAGFIATLGGVYALGIPLFLVLKLVDKPQAWLREPNLTTLVAALWLAAAATVLLAWLNVRGRWGLWRRGLGLTGIVLAVMAVLFISGWDWFPLRPADPAAVAQVAQAPLDVPLRAVEMNRVQSSPARLQVRLQPRPPALPAGGVLEWHAGEAACRLGETRLVPQARRSYAPLYAWRSVASHEDLRAIRQLLPPATLYLSGMNSFNESASAYLGEFQWPIGTGNDSGTNGALQARLEGRLYRWERVGELPLTVGATLRDATGVWSVVMSRPHPAECRQVFLRRDQFQSDLLGSPWTTRASDLFPGRYEFLLYWPQRHLAQVQDYRSGPRQSSGTLTAQLSAWLELNYSSTGLGAPASAGREAPRLLVFRKAYLGAFEKTWSASDVVWHEPPRPWQFDVGASGPPMIRTEFMRRLDGLRQPGTQPTRLEVARHLNEVLRLLAVSRVWLESDHPLARQWASWVPAHLDVFLSALEGANDPGQRLLQAALIRGLREEQQAPVLRALAFSSRLAPVVMARGWQAAAEPVWRQWLASPQALDSAVLRAVAQLEDPATYGRLLDELEYSPSATTYQALSGRPGISPGLDRCVGRIWAARHSGLQSGMSVTPALEVGLSHGLPEALAEALSLLQACPAKEGMRPYQLLSLFRSHVRLDGLPASQFHDDDRLLAWLAKRQARDFQFDPLRRRFIPRPPPA